MTELEKLKAVLKDNRVPVQKIKPEWAFQTAWNSTLEWVETMIAKIEKGEL